MKNLTKRQLILATSLICLFANLFSVVYIIDSVANSTDANVAWAIWIVSISILTTFGAAFADSIGRTG